jgi:hypothetical protein
MKTRLEKLMRANRWRIKAGQKMPAHLASSPEDGWQGWFLVPMEGELWQVCISDGMGFLHLSATNAQKRQLPSWQVMCRLKDAFFADEDWVVMYIPAKDDYVNDDPFVHDLWLPINSELPHPSVAPV